MNSLLNNTLALKAKLTEQLLHLLDEMDLHLKVAAA